MIKMIPSPKTYELSDEILRFPLRIFTEEAEFLSGCEVFGEAFRKLYGCTLSWETGGVVLQRDDALDPGAYVLDAGETLVARAAGTEGILYALAILCSWEQTFEQEVGAVMENLAALSERTWNVRRKVTDEEYNEMYQSQRLRLARLIQDR